MNSLIVASPEFTPAERRRGRQDSSLTKRRPQHAAEPHVGPRALVASEIQPEAVEWLWPERIPYGAITLLVGDPGLGKSLLSLRLVAELSRGAGSSNGGPKASLLLSAEDSRAHTVAPRLRALEADLSLIHFGATFRDGIEEGILVPNDIEALSDLVEQTDACLVVVDPLMAYLPGNVNSWMDQSVRHALAPLHRLAEKSGAAILVVGHLNKGLGTDPLQRIGGSVGISAAARSVLLLARDPDDPEAEQGRRRVLAHVKSNLGLLTASLAFEIEERTVSDSGPTALIAPRGVSPYSGTQLLVQQETRESKLARAIGFLEVQLTDGPKPASELQTRARELDISLTTLERCEEATGCHVGEGGPSVGMAMEAAKRKRGQRGEMSRIPREAREGLMRAWLSILSAKHPEVTWIAVEPAESGDSSSSHDDGLADGDAAEIERLLQAA